jgi:hypothetical protein
VQPELPAFTFVEDLFPTHGAAELCRCEQPIPKPRAERKGAARTYCARCDRAIPLGLGEPGRPQDRP